MRHLLISSLELLTRQPVTLFQERFAPRRSALRLHSCWRTNCHCSSLRRQQMETRLTLPQHAENHPIGFDPMFKTERCRSVLPGRQAESRHYESITPESFPLFYYKRSQTRRTLRKRWRVGSSGKNAELALLLSEGKCLSRSVAV
jgi:hypothetical protein